MAKKKTKAETANQLATSPDANVSGAGSPACNGLYTYDSASGSWIGGLFKIELGTDYPHPGDSSWFLDQGAQIYYYAPETASPWDAVWLVGSFGTAPVPQIQANEPPIEPPPTDDLSEFVMSSTHTGLHTYEEFHRLKLTA